MRFESRYHKLEKKNTFNPKFIIEGVCFFFFQSSFGIKEPQNSPDCFSLLWSWGFTGGSVGKESACNARSLGSIPVLGRSPGEGNGNPLQCSRLGNPMDRVEQGRLQSMGSQVRQDLVTKHHHHCEVKNNS